MTDRRVEVQEGASPDLRVMFRRGEDGYCWASVLGCVGVRQQDDGKVVEYVPLSVAESLAGALDKLFGQETCGVPSVDAHDARKALREVKDVWCAFRESYPAPVPAREEGTT